MQSVQSRLANREDVGSLVQVSNDLEHWETKILARIIADESDECFSQSFVCWADGIDGDDAKPSPYTLTFKYATVDREPASLSHEQRFLIEKQKIQETEQKLKQMKADLEQLEKVIQEDWIIDGIAKKEIRVDGGRRASLSIVNKLSCSINKADRETVRALIENYGIENVVVTDVDTARLKAWMTQGAEINPDGTFDLSSVPEDILSLVHIYQRGKLSVRSLGVKS